MNFSLFQATLITALLLLGLGLAFLLDRPGFRSACVKFLRSTIASYLTMGTAGAWFLYRVLQLGREDFGDYKHILFTVFGLAIVFSFKFLPDFLSVRGLCGLWLLLAVDLLAPGFGVAPKSLFLPSIIYVFIVLAIWVGVSPFRMRDFFTYLHRSALCSRLLGTALCTYAVVLFIAAFKI